jgi:signal transduction histidine kinase
VRDVALPEFPDLDQARVVVVDDNLPSVQLVQTLLTRAGHRSITAVTDPRQLLDRYDQLAPELIVLDLHMPGIDGFTMLDELRRRASAADLPILVLTADTTREATHRALGLGANDFLTKPLDATELVLRVGNLLRTRALHVALQRRQRWLEAATRLAADLLAGVGEDPLRRVSELALEAAGADSAVVVLPSVPEPHGSLVVTAHVWVGEDSGATAAVVADAFAARALHPEDARLVDDLSAAAGHDGRGATTGPAMVVPLRARDRLLGALLLCRRRGRPRFTRNELELAAGFAGQAVVAVEYAQARTDQERMLVLADRHRIARDLHDQVIQRLFATGLRLQQLAERVGPGAIAARLDTHVDELDATISEIRSTIFGLRQELAAAPGRLSFALHGLIRELAGILGFEPSVYAEEPLEVVPDDVGADLLAATREALTNVARHARARSVGVSVTLPGAELVLEVVDDGVGIGEAVRRSGLANLSERARRHGGSFTAVRRPEGGTRLVWTASLLESPAGSVASRTAPAPGSRLDRRNGDRPVDEELVRAGVVTGQPVRGRRLHLDGDVQQAMGTTQPDH